MKTNVVLLTTVNALKVKDMTLETLYMAFDPDTASMRFSIKTKCKKESTASKRLYKAIDGLETFDLNGDCELNEKNAKTASGYCIASLTVTPKGLPEAKATTTKATTKATAKATTKATTATTAEGFSKIGKTKTQEAFDEYDGMDFKQLVNAYEVIDINDINYKYVIFRLGVACVYATLKPVFKNQYTDLAEKLKKEVWYNYKTMQDFYKSLENYRDKKDKNKTLKNNVTDAGDLLQTACLTLHKTKVISKSKKAGWFTKMFKTKVLKTKVYIEKDITDSNAFKIIETSFYKNVLKAVRREMNKNRSVKILDNKTCYIEDVLKAGDKDDKITVYKRLNEYNQLASVSNDSTKVITIKQADYNKAMVLIDKMNLTDTQKEVLNYRIAGFGNKAIAEKMDISVSSVKTHRKRIQEKAEKIGLKATE